MEDEVQCVDFVELPIVQSQATSTTTSSTSILDKLKAPTKSDLARKRKVEPPIPKTTAANKKHKAGCFSINFSKISLLCLQQLFIMPAYAPMPLPLYYAQNYASIIRQGLTWTIDRYSSFEGSMR